MSIIFSVGGGDIAGGLQVVITNASNEWPDQSNRKWRDSKETERGTGVTRAL